MCPGGRNKKTERLIHVSCMSLTKSLEPCSLASSPWWTEQTCLHYWHWWIEDQAIFSLVLVSDSWPQKWINLVSSCPTEFWESSSYSRQLDHLSLKPENWVSYTSSRCVCVCILVFSTSLCSCLWYILLLVLKDKGEGISGHISLTHLGSNCFYFGLETSSTRGFCWIRRLLEND